ncbi:MAG: hypothetical protein ACLR0U_26145 [Enterocloster clostridioformis]
MVPTISIPYPLGNPSSSRGGAAPARRSRVEAALDALATDIKKQTIFESRNSGYRAVRNTVLYAMSDEWLCGAAWQGACQAAFVFA